MKKFFATTVWSISLIFGLLSCSKSGSGTPDDYHPVDESDGIVPVITVTRPVSNQVYSAADSIIVEGVATDNKSLYKGFVRITADAGGNIVKEQLYETHFLARMEFRVAFKATVAAAADFTVSIGFEDHGLNQATQQLKVKVNP